MAVVIVTDSTAYLPAEVLAAAGIRVVPLSVTVSGRTGLEGSEVLPADVARALGERRAHVTTSRPSPADFAAVYAEALASGADGIVSVHLSAKLSGTYEAAVLAAAQFAGRVRVVDSATAGVGVGFVAREAAITAAAITPSRGGQAAGGAALDAVEAAAVAAAGRVTTLFYVDTLEFLRRGGRISAAEAFLGTALSVKPILHTAKGLVGLRDKVRTAGRALARLADLAVQAADGSMVDIAVQHLAAPDRAAALRQDLEHRLGGQLRDSFLTEIGAVVAAHTGPGVIGVAVHRLP